MKYISKSVMFVLFAMFLATGCSDGRIDFNAFKADTKETQEETDPVTEKTVDPVDVTETKDVTEINEVAVTADSDAAVSKKAVVLIKTSLGDIKVELWPDKAPLTVKNFLAYVDEKYYDNLIFHRVIKDFMIQGGGFNSKMLKKRTRVAIKNEARVDVKNQRGTIAMARTAVVDSATSQFFINHKDNAFLNYQNDSARGFGYCVFGKVIEGMDVVDKIALVKTSVVARMRDVPADPVIIKSIRKEK